MIEIWSYRQKEGPEILLGNRYADIGEAIMSLCKYELGYGGQVTHLSNEKIEVATKILHCKDRTVYSGTLEEMKDLVVSVLLWHQAEMKVSAEEWWKLVSDVSNGVPLLVTMSAGILKGNLVKEKLREMLPAT